MNRLAQLTVDSLKLEVAKRLLTEALDIIISEFSSDGWTREDCLTVPTIKEIDNFLKT